MASVMNFVAVDDASSHRKRVTEVMAWAKKLDEKTFLKQYSPFSTSMHSHESSENPANIVSSLLLKRFPVR